jgi:hypothetical protein
MQKYQISVASNWANVDSGSGKAPEKKLRRCGLQRLAEAKADDHKVPQAGKLCATCDPDCRTPE